MKLKSVVAAVTGLVLGTALLFVAVPSSATPAPAPLAQRDGSVSGGCC